MTPTGMVSANIVLMKDKEPAMATPPTLRQRAWRRSVAFRIAAIYALVGVLWILFSDALLAAWFEDPVTLTLLQTVKGWMYILVTAVLLYGLIRRDMAAVRRSEETLKATIDSMADPVLVMDSRGTITNANQAALQILGLAEKTEILAPFSELQRRFQLREPGGRPIPVEESAIGRALGGETVRGSEVVLRRADGRDIHVMVSASPIRDAGGPRGVVVVLSDVTELRRLERLRDEFLSTAAHELKTPVTTIKGYAQMLRKWAANGRDPRESHAIEVINAQSDRISRRLQEMLEVVRFRTTSPLLHKSTFDLGDLASEVVELMQATTQIHRLVLTRDGRVTVEADRERIEEVLVSLLDNAIRFSPGGGDIHIRVWTEDGQALVSVKDCGVGIPRERQPYIFEPFYEPMPSGAAGYRGVVPLSLYLSKLTVGHHGGRIWFESAEGRGSTFYFSLPLAPDTSPRSPRTP